MDEQTERVNKVLEELLRACVLDFIGSWEDPLHLIEFSYNNSYQTNIEMMHFKALYERPCKSPTYWLETRDRLVLGSDLTSGVSEKIELIRKRMKEAQSRQKSYVDKRRKDLEFSLGESFHKVITDEGYGMVREVRKTGTEICGPILDHRKDWKARM